MTNQIKYKTKTASATLTIAEMGNIICKSALDITITLPSPSPNLWYEICNAGTGVVTVDYGNGTTTLNQNEQCKLYADVITPMWILSNGGSSGGSDSYDYFESRPYLQKNGEWIQALAPTIVPLSTIHRYWRLFITAGMHTNYLNLAELQFRSTRGVEERALGGTILASGGSRLEQAYDNIYGVSGNETEISPKTNSYIGYDFGVPKEVNQFAIYPAVSLDAAPKTFHIDYSDDGINWIPLTCSYVTNKTSWTKTWYTIDIVANSDREEFVRTNTAITDTIGIGDINFTIIETNSATITVTVPADSTVDMPVGTTIKYIQGDAGVISFAAAIGVTLHSPNGLATTYQWGKAELIKIGTNTWVLYV